MKYYAIEYGLVGVAAVSICLEITENRGVILVRRLSTRTRKTGEIVENRDDIG